MESHAEGSRPLKILIVDDSAEDRRAFKRMISECPKHTHEISEAETAYDGLVIAQIDDWDCIFLDYNLPDISGLDFLAEYRKHTPKVVLPVVMLTGQGRESVAVDAMKRGAFDYVAKSEASPERLNGIIHHALSVASMHRKEEEATRQRMRDEEEQQLRQIKAAELYAIGVTNSTYSQVLGSQLDAAEDALQALLQTESSPEQRRQVRAGLDALTEARESMQALAKLDLFGLLRYSTQSAPAAKDNGA
jgi:PleD family two-component response regulator